MISKLVSRWTFLIVAVLVTAAGVEHRLGVIASTHASSVVPAAIAAKQHQTVSSKGIGRATLRF